MNPVPKSRSIQSSGRIVILAMTGESWGPPPSTRWCRMTRNAFAPGSMRRGTRPDLRSIDSRPQWV